VPDLVLFQENHASTCLSERSRGGNAHDSRPDDDDVCVDRPKRALARYGAIPRAAFAAARESAW
jgi:hypothetical protein